MYYLLQGDVAANCPITGYPKSSAKVCYGDGSENYG